MASAAQLNHSSFNELDRPSDVHETASDDIAALDCDQFNVEAQMRIEELIQYEAIMENLVYALEYHPESFARVNML
jgi:hypothetical protein